MSKCMFWFSGLVIVCLSGCQAWTAKPPMEALTQQIIDQVIAPAVEKGLANGVENLDVMGGVQGINPGYKTDFEGFWVTGVKGSVKIGIDGVAGQVQGASSGDKPKTEPAKTEPATQPSE